VGYTTEFDGRFNLDKPLTEAHAAYLRALAETRRMKRNPELCAKRPDPLREAVGLPVGEEGEYFVAAAGTMGQSHEDDVVEYNWPPKTQPGLWLQWIPTKDLAGFEWDGTEKFYNYEEWLVYLVENFLKPWGYVLNGSVEWSGEEGTDNGYLLVEDNEVSTTM